MDREAFEKLVEEAIFAIPQKFRSKLKNVVFLVEDAPSPGVRAREHLGAGTTLLGYYHGIPLTERGTAYGVGPTMPDTITIYQRPIESAADDPSQIKKLVYDTVWHEVAHYFGLGEAAVRAREKRRR